MQTGTPRDRILSAAKAVFAERGYVGGSLNEVSKRSGYTRAGLLHHFPSKDAMLLALLELRDEELKTFSESRRDRSLLESTADLPDLVSQVLRDRALVRLAHALTAEASDPDHPARAWAANRHRALRELIRAEIRISIERGELREDTDAAALATVLLGAVEGVEGQWLLDDDINPHRCAKVLTEMITALVAAHRLVRTSPPRTADR